MQKKTKVKWVPPSELPCNNATSEVWRSENENEYTCESLLELAAERRLGLQADRMTRVASASQEEDQHEDHDTQPMSDLEDDV